VKLLDFQVRVSQIADTEKQQIGADEVARVIASIRRAAQGLSIVARLKLAWAFFGSKYP